MRKLLRTSRNLVLGLLGVALVGRCLAAIDASQWKTRQTFTVDHAGIVKLSLPPATLDAAQPQLQDLRLLDASGREVAYLTEIAAPKVQPTTRAPSAFEAVLADRGTKVTIRTGTTEPLGAVALSTPAPSFLKPAQVETSLDGEHWTVLRAGAVFFRQHGAQQLELPLDRQTAAYIRITIDDSRSDSIPVTGATLLIASTIQPAAHAILPDARVTNRDEFAAETVLTIDLGGQHVPLHALVFATDAPLFTRHVTIGVHELQSEAIVERTVATGTIYRVSAEGSESRAQLEVPITIATPSRELLVHIENGDSPPLSINSIAVQYRPVWLVFSAPTAGTYTLLTGNPDAAAARYDVSAFAASLKQTTEANIAVSPVEINAGYTRRAALGDTPLVGGAIDPKPWRFSKAATVTKAGVQQLELDVDVLANSGSDFRDLRLVRDGVQVPYVISRSSLSRSLPLQAEAANDPKRPQVSRWRFKLPRAKLPLTQFTVTSSTPLFQRRLRLFETVRDEQNGAYDRSIAEAAWNKMPGRDESLTLPTPIAPVTDTLILETDNGDNPPLLLSKASVGYPVVRLVFKSDVAPLTLYYGNPEASAPRYDITLVAEQLTKAEKNVATLAREEHTAAPTRFAFPLERAGYLFWGALALVVVALLVIVAKLLPKTPAPPS